jgi:hypothetical protein
MEDASSAELKVRFLITSQVLTPDQISASVGVSPSRTWIKGQKVHQKATKTYSHNGWVLIAEARGAHASAETLADEILRGIDMHRMLAFKSEHADAEFELSIIVYLSQSAPAVSLSPAQVGALANLGAGIDVDIYPG